MSNILQIQPRIQDLRTSTSDDWTDGFPLWRAGGSGVVVGAANVGDGGLTVSAVDAMTPLGGHRVEVTGVGNGLFALTVTDPNGIVTAYGFAGAPLSAGGITFAVTLGTTPFAIGDAFAIQVTPTLIDDTGISYVLQVRKDQQAANVAFQAASDPTDGSTPTISGGQGGGNPALIVPHTLMAADRLPPGTYVYELLATADGRRKSAYSGTLTHVAGAAFIP